MSMSPRLLRPRATGFSPKSISGLAGWYDFADQSTITLNTGFTPNRVSQIADKSGNGRNFSQDASSRQSDYAIAKRNGLNVLTNNAPSGGVLNGNVPLTANTAIFIVVEKRESGQQGGIFLAGETVGGNNPPAFGTQILNWDFFYYGDAFRVIANQNVAPTGLSVIALSQTDGAALGIYLNGAIAFSQATASQALSGKAVAVIGASNSIGTNAVVVDIAEILIYNATLTTSQRASVTSYLGKKWGITVT